MIRVLPDIVQNKIAAGEVVERPASAVKELVENAIDAGAGKIIIEIEEGGMRSIRITDDGCGMNKEDLELSIQRHATSKIHDVEDIFRISTMGFRGEALPSIGAVSRLSISTGIAGEGCGYTLKVVGGKVEGVQPAPPRQGTTVEVNDLFFNTPARRKFMKSTAAEVGAINETVTRIALGNPGIAFILKNNGNTSLELLVRVELGERIRDLFGKNLELLPVNYTTSNGELTIAGYCSKPPESRGSSKFIYTLLNKRWIKHPGINRGVVDACQGHLPPRRYPFAVLTFEIDPAKVDVNAHPTKEVVRFENDSLFVGGCRKALAAALSGNGNMPGQTGLARQLEQVHGRAEEYIIRNNPSRSLGEESKSYGGELKSGIERYDFRMQPAREGFVQNTSHNFKAAPLNDVTTADSSEKPDGYSMAADSDNSRVDGVSEQGRIALGQEPALRYVGQVGNKYILAESPEGLVVIDQHALHERWNYNRLSKQEHGIDSQRLLLPVEIELSAVEQALLTESMSVLEEAGFALRLEGAVLSITAHPDIIRPHNIERVVRDILSDIDSLPIKEYRDRINASLACRSAVLFGTSLSPELCRDLVAKLAAGDLYTCPHGRPTQLLFTWKELAYKFER